MIDSISILVPSIRTNRLVELYNSIPLSCKRYLWELVLISPFDLPDELQNKSNITLVKDYGNVNRCIHKGILETKYKTFFTSTDDSTFAQDALDLALDVYNEKCDYKDVVCGIYGENGDKQDTSYWSVARHDYFKMRLIDQSWKLANQPIMSKNRFIELGGVAQIFECFDSAIHDFQFRNQLDGAKIYYSPKHICIASWFPGTSFDHRSIHFGQTEHDEPIFRQIWSGNYRQIKLDFDDWKNSPPVWERRFTKGKCSSYKELCQQEGYNMEGTI